MFSQSLRCEKGSENVKAELIHEELPSTTNTGSEPPEFTQTVQTTKKKKQNKKVKIKM